MIYCLCIIYLAQSFPHTLSCVGLLFTLFFICSPFLPDSAEHMHLSCVLKCNSFSQNQPFLGLQRGLKCLQFIGAASCDPAAGAAHEGSLGGAGAAGAVSQGRCRRSQLPVSCWSCNINTSAGSGLTAQDVSLWFQTGRAISLILHAQKRGLQLPDGTEISGVIVCWSTPASEGSD